MKQPIPFGKYFLLERVNVGGMAEVFKAKATGVEGFERLVAVKRILPSIAEDEEFITMFVDEAKIAVQLTHANIAQIFDLGRVDGSFFIALEYVHGKDLRAIFNRGRQRGELLPVPMSCYAIMKVCEGLDYAHNKRDASGGFLNLVHRDVSPQNILVSYEGEVKIIDFGIAKAAGKAGRTQAGILKGKFGYMSPEQVQGMEIDRRSDVFGVGICLYELLTGERLFVGESDFATLEKVRNVDIMPPSTYNRRVPEELEQIVLKALARDREERYQTAMQLHDDLQSFMYTSGNFFSRKDLSLYMHRVFTEEIDKENARDQEYASMHVGLEEAEPTGLHAFDEIDPVSTVSALNAQPPHAAATQRSAPQSAPGSALPKKSTLLGMPTVKSGSAPIIQSRVPGLVPRPQSIPPSAAPPPARSGLRNPAADLAAAQNAPRSNSMSAGPRSSPQLAPAAPRVPSGAGLGMEWDDEELSTQIYDKPDDSSALAAMARGPQPAASSTGSLPPVLITTPNPHSSPVHPAFAHAQPASGSYQAARGSAPSGTYAPAQQAPQQMYRGETMDLRLRTDPTVATQEESSWSRASRGKPMVMAVIAVLAILGIIVAGLALFGKAEPATLHLATVPRNVLVTIDGHPASGQTSPFVLGELQPNTTHAIEVSSPGYRSWSSQVDLQPGQTMELPTVTLEKIEAGFSLDSVPQGASVVVDGRKLAQATPVRVTDLEPGDHHVRLEHEGFAPWESSLHVTPGSVLELQTATLKPTSPETGATVVPAPAPAPAPSNAAPAPRREPSAPRAPRAPSVRAPSSSPVVIAPAPAEAAPEPAPAPRAAPSGGGTGTLRVNTRPWSKVFVDGRLIGNTPQMNIPLEAGRHSVTLVNDDFSIRKTIKVEIRAGEVETQVLTLTE
ncbi:MAG TPA: PEGA domain-containing protein [Polyangiales bacterium]|nr:PEGA domain-containing protein [Polyangiales bacterium]